MIAKQSTPSSIKATWDCGKMPGTVTAVLTEDGTLTICGMGEMWWDTTGAEDEHDFGEYVPWFESKRDITSVIIEHGVTNIARDAFLFHKSLTRCVIPDSVTKIEQDAFCGCNILADITIPNNVTDIGMCAFWNCQSLTSITIPNSVRTISDYAFSDCCGLTSVSISNGVMFIETGAFDGCKKLTSVTIPNSVEMISERAFYNNASLMSIEVAEDNAYFCSVDGVLFNKDKTVLMQYPASKQGAYTIPDGVETICYNAMDNCPGLTSVVVPNSVAAIRQYTFDEYRDSDSAPIYVPDRGDAPFYHCTGLTSIEVAEDNAHYCSVDGVLFNKDKTLLIQYPPSKQGAYTIPDGVLTIGKNAFDDCRALTSVTIPKSVTEIGQSAFCDCRGLTSISIPNSVTKIGTAAFDDCQGLTSVSISDNVTTIAKGLFCGCKSLRSITIPNGVTVIGYLAFSGCEKISAISIPNSVKTVERVPFSDCANLTTITIPNSVPPEGVAELLDCNKSDLYVPEESVAAYSAAITAAVSEAPDRKDDPARIMAIGG